MARYCLTISLAVFLLSCAEKPSPQAILEQAKTMMAARQTIHHTSVYHWENALDEMDTFQYDLQFLKKDNEYFDYDYIAKGAHYDVIYINDEFKIINHRDSTVEVFPPSRLENNIDRIRNTMALAFNPVLLLQQDHWTYLRDTTVDGAVYHDYYEVEMDTVIDGKKIHLQRHLFINPATKTPAFFSNRLYHNGSRSQLINAYFADYDFGDAQEALTYLPPRNYLSISGKDKNQDKRMMLKAGDMAPDFELSTLDGKSFKLSDMRGQKVLLDFSMINCGWCNIALEHFTRQDFRFRPDIKPIYINPVDPEEDVKKYQSLKNIPFPIIAGAETVGKAYGVSGYPSFFLIDEKGIIEKAFAGYDRALVMEWGQ
ncbi:peroxiredoxin family protein [Echinicola vietnamensis]|uniref:Peroxiredoxin n=1 Tax=Echinicola vietnamensis (strain DSM 17526 / LMG 23754 / KMM 6221) TaxID=926556 RepID=L0G620_ECHVK|nr:peroxiredoxin family protein [Echinicola vietnamensis]AGA80743.1 Peroxiredoxin [Echinicola vietnamensis DSM 17526]